MPQTGLITPTNLGIVTRPCTEQQQSQNLSNIANNLINLQTQIGDPSTLPPIISQIPGLDGVPGGPGGPGTSGTDGPAGTSGIDLSSLIRQILQTIQTIINTMPSPGGSGLPGWGGLALTSQQDIVNSAWGAWTDIAFNAAMPVSNVTATTGASAKLTVANTGKFAVNFCASAFQTPPGNNDLWAEAFRFRLVVNGSEPSPVIRDYKNHMAMTIDDTDESGGVHPTNRGVLNAILSLTAGDEVKIQTWVNCDNETLKAVYQAAGTVTPNAENIKIVNTLDDTWKVSLLYGQVSILQLG